MLIVDECIYGDMEIVATSRGLWWRWIGDVEYEPVVFGCWA